MCCFTQNILTLRLSVGGRTDGRTDGQKIFTQYSGISSCSVGSTDSTVKGRLYVQCVNCMFSGIDFLLPTWKTLFFFSFRTRKSCIIPVRMNTFSEYQNVTIRVGTLQIWVSTCPKLSPYLSDGRLESRL